MLGLDALESALKRIDLHTLPSVLVTNSMVLISTVIQFKYKVELAVKCCYQMEEQDFEDFFQTLFDMNSTLWKTVEDFEKNLEKIKIS
jgi:predicted PilT family ATPase